MAGDEPPEGAIRVPIVWTGVDDVPILYANGFVSQFDQEAFIITIGQVAPPALIGTPEEVEEQARELEFITVRPITRLALTPPKMAEFIAILQANLDQYERATTLKPGDPR